MTLPIEAIVYQPWAEDLATRSGNDGIINYAIISKAGRLSRKNYGVSTAEANGIRGIFAELDAITGASLEETRQEDANIVLYSVKRYRRNWQWLTEFNAKHFVATWKDYGGKRLTSYESAVIRHEIGHTLGLDHPFNDGYYEGATTADTIMSYNNVSPTITSYSPLDIQALQMLWGTGP